MSSNHGSREAPASPPLKAAEKLSRRCRFMSGVSSENGSAAGVVFTASLPTITLSPPPTQRNLSVWFRLVLHKQGDFSHRRDPPWFLDGFKTTFFCSWPCSRVVCRLKDKKRLLTVRWLSYSLTACVLNRRNVLQRNIHGHGSDSLHVTAATFKPQYWMDWIAAKPIHEWRRW